MFQIDVNGDVHELTFGGPVADVSGFVEYRMGSIWTFGLSRRAGAF